MPRTGRPPLPPDERRSVILRIRLTEAESELLAKVAPRGEVADWARTKLLATARAAAKKARSS